MNAQDLLTKLQALAAQGTDLAKMDVSVRVRVYNSDIEYDRGYDDSIFPDGLEVDGSELALTGCCVNV